MITDVKTKRKQIRRKLILFRPSKTKPYDLPEYHKIKDIDSLPELTSLDELGRVLEDKDFSVSDWSGFGYMPVFSNSTVNKSFGWEYKVLLAYPLIEERLSKGVVVTQDGRYYTDGTAYSPEDNQAFRIARLSEALSRVKIFLDCFTGDWSFSFQPNAPRMALRTGNLFGMYSDIKNALRSCDAREIASPLIQSLDSTVKKAEKRVEYLLQRILRDELPNMERLESILQMLINIEKDQQSAVKDLTAQFERKEKEALEEQRNEFESRLDLLQKNYQKQLIESQEELSQMHRLIDNIFGQNDKLIEAMQSKSEGYEDRMMAILRTLKDEL